MEKKIIIIVIVVISALIVSFLLAKSIINMQQIGVNETEVTGKEISKEEYLYKEELLSLGYNVSEIEIIEKKISNIDVKNYLLTKKYNKVTQFVYSSLFKIKNIEKYQNYSDKEPKLSTENVVLHVELGLDHDFYTNIKPADTSANELILVNKYYSIDTSYNANLVDIGEKYGKGKMNYEAYVNFVEMCDDALKDGIVLKSISAYRSYDTQKNLYNKYVKKDGVAKADTYSARPGHSEHQTGLAVDINTAATSAHFENSKEYTWLMNNAYKYGFILRYPKGKEYITGYQYEPWHFRYVGEHISKEIHDFNVTLEEYLVM